MKETSQEQTQIFVRHLEELDPGAHARLKRCAGHSMKEARGALTLFYSILPHGVPQAQEEIYFLVATLYPLAENSGQGNLGDALRRARTDQNARGLDRRLEALLDANIDQLPFRLRQTIHFLQSNRIRVNYQTLLTDLLYWSHPDHFIQQRWARSYFSSSKEKNQ